VRVPWGALGLAGGILNLAHLIHHDEWVEGSGVNARESAANREALTLKTLGRSGDADHWTWPHEAGIRTTDMRQNGDVFDGNCGHRNLQVVKDSTIPRMLNAGKSET
jgi:hypothetical protein